MSNLLLNPSFFVDNNGNTPPAQWDGAKYSFIYSEQGYDSIYSGPQLSVAVGDTLQGSLVNHAENDLTIYVTLNSTQVLVHTIAPGATYALNVTFAQAGYINMQFTATGVYSMDAVLTPTGLPIEDGDDENPNGADTYSAKGFLSFGAMVNNTNRQVAALGELSVYSQTFARDRELFSTGSGGSTDTAITAAIFSSASAADGDVDVPVQYGELLAEIGAWVYTQANDGAFTSNPETFRQAVLAEFESKLYQLSVGAIVQQGTIFLPESMTFYLNANAVVTTGPVPAYLERSRIKLWLSDAAFKSQYDEFSYEFIAPVDVLDDLFKTRDQVEAAVARRTQSELMLKIQTLADGDPYTVLKSENFDKHDPDDISYRLPTNWTFLIYGAAGDNIDAIKEKLIEWILDNSTHTREEWAEIYPDIFTSTEFILAPFWTSYAIPNQTLEQGVYSPTATLNHARAVARATAVGTKYTAAHVDSVASYVATTYKSLAMVVTGGPENRDGINRFYAQFKDYIAVNTTSIDFDRMQKTTQDWVAMMYALLKVAEEMTEFSDIPAGMTRLRRTDASGNSVLYVVKSYRNVQYLVVSKLSMNKYFPPVEVAPLQLSCEGIEGVTTMPNGEQFEPYTSRFQAIGGVGPMTYSLAQSLPDKISTHQVDPVSGEYNALFDASGSTKVTASVVDSTGARATVEFDLYILAGTVPQT